MNANLPVPAFARVPIELLRENEWNPNKMTDFMFRKALESISEFGFLAPVLVKRADNGYVIIDGAHRYRAAKQLKLASVPIIIVDGLSDAQYRKLTVVLNELHGQPDPGKLSELLKGLVEETSMAEVLNALPFAEDTLKGFVGFEGIELPSAPPPAPKERSERWVERTFRMPASASAVVSDAIETVKRQDPSASTEDWQALELICAEFLAGS